MEEMMAFSYYKDLSPVDNRENIRLVMHIETQRIYVKKELTEYNREVYELIRAQRPEYFPRIYELAEDEKLHIIEEHINGKSLQTLIEQYGRLTPVQAKLIMMDICEAVAYLHQQHPPIIHRDLKPSNIMQGPDKRWKIVDLNIARRYDPNATQDTEYLGTRDYAAPEQYGFFHQTDVRTDIYSLGIILNYILTGKHPKEYVAAGALGAVVRKCVKFEPSQRYQSVEELWTAISNPEQEVKDQEKERIRVDQTRDKQERQRAKEERIRAKREQSNAKKDSMHPEQTNRRGRRIYLPSFPPGFRTLTWWHMLLAVFGYWAIFWSCLTMEVHDVNGLVETGFLMWMNRILFLIWFLIVIFLFSNYRNIQRKLPILKRWNRLSARLIGCAVYSVLIIVVFMSILVGLENMIL